MNKREIIGSALALTMTAAVVVMAAAPLARNFYKHPSDITVDAQYTGTWDTSDSLVYVASDSAAVVVTVTATAVMDPNDAIYIGIGNSGSANSGAPSVDTVICKANRSDRGKVEVPITFRKIIANNGALTDTLYLAFACGGSSPGEVVTVRDICLTAQVADQ